MNEKAKTLLASKTHQREAQSTFVVILNPN